MAPNAFFYIISGLEVFEWLIIFIVMTFPALSFEKCRVFLLIGFLVLDVVKNNDGILMVVISLSNSDESPNCL